MQQSRERVVIHAPSWFGADSVANRYEELFGELDWASLAAVEGEAGRVGRLAHPEGAYVKAYLVMVEENIEWVSQLARYLCEHPALVWVLGFRLVADTNSPYGFDVRRSVPSAGHLRAKLRTLDRGVLKQLLNGTVEHALAEIPALGELVAVDVKHIYAYVKQNNPRAYVAERFNPDYQPDGDADCRLGVKTASNRTDETGRTRTETEYLWGYGSGIAVAPTPDKDAIVVAETTQTFDRNDVTYAKPLLHRAMDALGFAPPDLTADAAFDAWYVYQWSAELGGTAAIALNSRGHPPTRLEPHDRPVCACNGAEMQPQAVSLVDTHRIQFFYCPECQTTRQMNIELGHLMRLRLDRQSDPYKALYRQRTTVERVNSQAEALGIDRPHFRTMPAIARRNTLIYIVINLRALQRFRKRHPSSQPLLNAA